MASIASTPKHWLIIPAAGIGARMAAPLPKQYLELHGKTILERTIQTMLDTKRFESVLIGLHPDDTYFDSLPDAIKQSVACFVGGTERVSTVLNGLKALQGKIADHDWVWVHDAARPFVSAQELDDLHQALNQTQVGALLALPSTDTVKLKSDQGVSTLDRRMLWRAQTPQVFSYALLFNALNQALLEQVCITDESSAIEHMGQSPVLVPGKNSNIKVTQPEDLELARRFVDSAASAFSDSDKKRTMHSNIRIGSGYDVHAFEEGDFLTLGGVKIAYSKSFKAHSDGDVLLHALCDAMLGALALGDIGHHFPDTDARWKGANSRDLLKAVRHLVEEKGFRLGNADMTIMAQAPKMAPHIDLMRKNIAEDLQVPLDCVSVKATTTEKLGFTGREEGIACEASVLLVAKS